MIRDTHDTNHAVWPPPRAARPILARARRRYHARAVTDRPALEDTTCALGILTREELEALACASYYPLPRRAVEWLARSPASQRQQRRRLRRVLLRLLTDDIADIALAVAQEAHRA